MTRVPGAAARSAAARAIDAADLQIPEDILLAAGSRVTVLITAPDHAVRLAYARFIHDHGGCRSGPFLPVSCAAGECHRPIARMLEEARGGTLFLDEIGALTREAQEAVLGMLETLSAGAGTRRVRRAHDVRVIAGATGSLAREIAEGTFNSVLFYRLNVVHLRAALPGRASGEPG
jgi:DNA-binding NtrC family response regulator